MEPANVSTPSRRHFMRAGTAAALTAASYRRVLGANERVGLGFTTYHRHFGHRFVLAGEKPK